MKIGIALDQIKEICKYMCVRRRGRRREEEEGGKV